MKDIPKKRGLFGENSNTPLVCSTEQVVHFEENIGTTLDELLKSANFFKGIPIVYVQDTTVTLSPNTYYIFNGTPASLTITFSEPLSSTYLCEYMFEFTSGSSGDIQISLPNGVQWYEVPEIEANKKYQVSISRGIGLIIGVDVV